MDVKDRKVPLGDVKEDLFEYVHQLLASFSEESVVSLSFIRAQARSCWLQRFFQFGQIRSSNGLHFRPQIVHFEYWKGLNVAMLDDILCFVRVDAEEPVGRMFSSQLV